MKDETLVKVFVYGTLRKGNGNHRLLEDPSVKFLCNDTIRAKMYTCHWGFPYIVFSQSNKDRVIGEIYEVPYWLVKTDLDSLEGYRPGSKSNFYNRKKALTASKHVVYVYECGPSMRRNQCYWIHSGDWMTAKEGKQFPRLDQAHKIWTDEGFILTKTKEFVKFKENGTTVRVSL